MRSGRRTTACCSKAGASVKEAMSLSRHNNPMLMLVTYGRARNERLKTVANALGEIVLGEEGAD